MPGMKLPSNPPPWPKGSQAFQERFNESKRQPKLLRKCSPQTTSAMLPASPRTQWVESTGHLTQSVASTPPAPRGDFVPVKKSFAVKNKFHSLLRDEMRQWHSILILQRVAEFSVIFIHIFVGGDMVVREGCLDPTPNAHLCVFLFRLGWKTTNIRKTTWGNIPYSSRSEVERLPSFHEVEYTSASLREVLILQLL